MRAIIKAALHVAKSYPVFPTTKAKLPCWSNRALGCAKGEGGFKVATQDRDRIIELFSHPQASQVSVPCGPMSGLLVVDPDLYKGKHVVDWHEENKHWLEKTLCHQSKNGGLHYLFEWTDKVRFPSTLAEGVDVKGHGGYVVFPPSDGYTVLRKRKVQPFPVDILQAAMIAKGGSGNVVQLDSYNSSTDDDLIERIQKATALYPSLRSLAYRMPGRRQSNGTYLSETEMIRILNNVMDTSVAASPAHPRHEDWLDRRGKIPELVKTAMEKENAVYNELTDLEVSAMSQGESFIKTQEMIAASSRPIGPQRETQVTDILDRVADIKKLVPISKDATKSTSDFVELSVGQLAKNALPPIKWIIPRMIPEQSTVSLAGMSNVGKTRWIGALAVALAVGDTKRMGLPQCPKKITSVFIANEERADDIARRLRAVVLQHGDKGNGKIIVRGKDAGMLRLVAMNEAGNLEIDEANVAGIVHEIQKAKAKLVIVDPYVTLSDGGADENSASSASMLTKAFLLITSATGAAVLHAHHAPKDRQRDNDNWRGEATAWRGSGGIYSALDCGFTLSHWMPGNKDQRKAWKAQYISAKLSRFIVLDTAKMREGQSLDPVMMELVGQELPKGEGDPIGVCKLTTEADASNALLQGSVDAIELNELAVSMVSTLGEGRHTNMSEAHRAMTGHELWPNTTKREGKDKLLKMFEEKFYSENGSVQVIVTPGRKAKWEIVIEVSG